MTVDITQNSVIEFVELKRFLDKVGLELIGSKDIANERVYLIKKKELENLEKKENLIF